MTNIDKCLEPRRSDGRDPLVSLWIRVPPRQHLTSKIAYCVFQRCRTQELRTQLKAIGEQDITIRTCIRLCNL
jgi:hypothetical protein